MGDVMVKAADYINLIFHLVILFSFLYVGGLGLIAKLSDDSQQRENSPFGTVSTAWCGFTAIIGSVALFLGWMFYLAFPGTIPLEGRSASWWLHLGFGLTSAAMMFVAGIALFQRWVHALVLNLLSVAALLSANFFPLLAFHYEGTPATFHNLALSFGVFMILIVGTSFTARSLHEMEMPKKGLSGS